MEAEEKVDGNHQNTITGKQKCDMQGRPAQRHMFGLFGGADVHVVFEMAFGERSARAMQHPAVVRVLKCIAPDQPNNKPDQTTLPTGMKKKAENQSGQNSGDGCDDCVVLLPRASV